MRASRNSFNGGEISDWLDSRLDLPKFHSGCRTLLNSHVIRYGGSRRRSGFLKGGQCAANTVRLQGFNFGRATADDAAVLEFSDEALRFWNGDATQIMDGGAPLELVTPWTAAQLDGLDFAQKFDVIILTSPDHLPQCLKRYAADSWELLPIAWKVRPWSDLNTTDTTLQILTGNILEASAAIFDSSWIGSHVRLVHPVPESITSLSFYHVWYRRVLNPADYNTTDDVKTASLSNTNYDITPNTGGTDRLRYDVAGTGLDRLYTCIAPYNYSTDYVSGVLDPAEYPAHFEPGILAHGPVTVTGRWEFETTGTWTGSWRVQRSFDDGANWETVAAISSEENNNRTVSGEEEPTNPALFRVLAWEANSAHQDQVFFRILTGSVTDEVEITGYTSPTRLTFSPVADLTLDTPTLEWSDDAFSPRNGYPSSCTFHQGRLFFAGTAAEPERLWHSKTEDFFNFEYGTAADSAASYLLNANRYNAITWLCSQQHLLIGTTGGEWSSFTTDGAPITPENTQFHLHTHHGSDAHPGLILSDSAVFVQRQGRKIREFAPSPVGLGNYASPDLTELAEHITTSGIKQIAKLDSPDTTLLALRNDGQLALLTFERSQNLYAWQRFTTAGTIKSIATTYGTGEDDSLFIAVTRDLNGTPTTFLERLQPDTRTLEDDPANTPALVYLDHATRHTSETPFTTITIGTEYNGLTVEAASNLASLGTFTVAGGDITLPTSQTDVWTGLPYLSETEPMPVEAGGLGNKLAYHAAHVRTRNTHSYQLSNSEREEWEDVTTTDSPELLTTGTRVDTLPNMAEHGQSVVIRQYHPGPLTVISIDLQTSAGTS